MNGHAQPREPADPFNFPTPQPPDQGHQTPEQPHQHQQQQQEAGPSGQQQQQHRQQQQPQQPSQVQRMSESQQQIPLGIAAGSSVLQLLGHAGLTLTAERMSDSNIVPGLRPQYTIVGMPTQPIQAAASLCRSGPSLAAAGNATGLLQRYRASTRLSSQGHSPEANDLTCSHDQWSLGLQLI